MKGVDLVVRSADMVIVGWEFPLPNTTSMRNMRSITTVCYDIKIPEKRKGFLKAEPSLMTSFSCHDLIDLQ